MSLRRSPKRTQALLAANRANSRKSTGPRTALGQWPSAWNAVQHGRRTRGSSCIPIAGREADAFMEFYFNLRDAVIPAENLAGTKAVMMTAVRAWKVKRILNHWIETQTEEDWLILATGAVRPPSFWRLRLRRPGLSVPDWTVTISVWLRWGRGPGQSPPSTPEGDTKPDRPRMHTMVSVRATGPLSSGGVLETERTKPECDRNQGGSENMSVPAGREAASDTADERERRSASPLVAASKRTKPEYRRKEDAYKNVSGIGQSPKRGPKGSGHMTRLGKIVGIVRTAFTSRKQSQEVRAVRTRPECERKKGAYKNMSKTLGRLGAAASFLLNRAAHKPAPRTRQAQNAA